MRLSRIIPSINMKNVLSIIFLLPIISSAQLKWTNVDSLFGPLPKDFHVYYSNDTLDGKPNIAYYVEAKLKSRHLEFKTDTTYKRRLTPKAFYTKNDNPLLVVNGTFFSFATNQNLNIVIKEGKMVSYNVNDIPAKGKDTFTYHHISGSALGITKKRKADVGWLFTDSARKYAVAFEKNPKVITDPLPKSSKYTYAPSLHHYPTRKRRLGIDESWKMQTAIGGGPVLLHDGAVRITNNEERKFVGKGISDKHPRTAMGYTKDGRLIILVIQGRVAGKAEGATLVQEANILKDLSCWEALNFDGGGSSCMLVNGKETILPSDKEGERAVPAVFIIKRN